MWLYYVNVDSVLATVERIRAAGGRIVMGPHSVPGGSQIVHALDPQGVLFALVGPGTN
jgi:predicted enzyme related to lactoylglutathione lyase